MNDHPRKPSGKPARPVRPAGSRPQRPQQAPAAASREGGVRFACPVADKCGGCQLSHLSYEEQLHLKQQKVEKLLGGLCPVEPILGMDDPFHYRSKVHAVIAEDRRKQPISGVYAAGTHRVVPVKGCLIEDPRADRIIQTIVGMIPHYKLRIYNENTHRGFLRHVLVRTGHITGQIMVVLVTTASEFPGGKAFVQELIQHHPEITTVVLISTGPSGRFPKVTPPPFLSPVMVMSFS